MPAAIPVAIRQIIVERHLQGDPLPAIARDLSLSIFSVRNIWRRYRDDPLDDLRPRYHIHTQPLSHPRVVRAALLLKRRHPGWGAEFIRVQIADKWPDLPLPSLSAIRRWFQAANLQPPRSRLPAVKRAHTTTPHAVWQVDAVSQVEIASGARLCWLTITDEGSGAILRVRVFNIRIWEQVTAAEVAAALAGAFVRWGRPERLRFDNGAPWGGWNDLPRELALWLIGLGIGIIWNKPHRPQQNGKVERSHGVCKAWAEPEQCANDAELQRRLERAALIQRERYPAIAGLSRLAAHPELRHSGREYQEGAEEEQWQESRVYEWLAKGVWQRRVGQNGQISLYGRHLSAGREYGGQNVQVRLDATSVEWVITTAGGKEVGRYAATELSRERILRFDVLQRREKGKRKGAKAVASLELGG